MFTSTQNSFCKGTAVLYNNGTHTYKLFSNHLSLLKVNYPGSWLKHNATKNILCWQGPHEWICWLLFEVFSLSPYGPTMTSALSSYFIFTFPDSLITDEDKFFPDKLWVWVLILVEYFQCEYHCFTDRTLHLQVINSIEIHKYQVVRILPGKD